MLCLVNALLLQAHIATMHQRSVSRLPQYIYGHIFFLQRLNKLVRPDNPPTPVNRQGQQPEQIGNWNAGLVDEFGLVLLGKNLSPQMRSSSVFWIPYEPWVINSNEYLSHTSPGSPLPTGTNVHNHRTISLYQCRVQKHHSNLPFQSVFSCYWLADFLILIYARTKKWT